MSASEITFDVNNLFIKKEVLMSKEEISRIVFFAIQNGIVKIETETMCVPADEDFIEVEHNCLRLRYESTSENVLIKPFDFKEDSGNCK